MVIAETAITSGSLAGVDEFEIDHHGRIDEPAGMMRVSHAAWDPGTRR